MAIGLCKHYIHNHQRHPHITTVDAFHHTRQRTVRFRAFRVLLHGVARVNILRTSGQPVQKLRTVIVVCLSARFFLVIKLHLLFSAQLCRNCVGAFPLRILALVSLAQLLLGGRSSFYIASASKSNPGIPMIRLPLERPLSSSTTVNFRASFLARSARLMRCNAGDCDSSSGLKKAS